MAGAMSPWRGQNPWWSQLGSGASMGAGFPLLEMTFRVPVSADNPIARSLRCNSLQRRAATSDPAADLLLSGVLAAPMPVRTADLLVVWCGLRTPSVR